MADTTEDYRNKYLYLLRKIEQMQGHIFYIESDDGVLRRWIPPSATTPYDGKDQPNDR